MFEGIFSGLRKLFGTEHIPSGELTEEEKAHIWAEARERGQRALDRHEEELRQVVEDQYFRKICAKKRELHFDGLHGNILDVGCSDGIWFKLLKRLGAEKIYGVEPDKRRIPDAKKRPEVDPENIYNCLVEDLPGRFDGFFDYVVVLYWELGHPAGEEDRYGRMNQKERERLAIAGLARVLKPEGKILVLFDSGEGKDVLPEIKRHFKTRTVVHQGICLLHGIKK